MKSSSFARFRLLGIFFSILAALVMLQMVRLQTSAAAEPIKARIKASAYDKRKIYPERGSIYDRWGRMLAGNIEVYEVGAELQFVDSPETIAVTMATILDKDYAEVEKAVKLPYIPGESEYVILADFVGPEKIKELENLKREYAKLAADSDEENPRTLRGLVWTPHLMRSYPEKTLASNILGFYSFRDRDAGNGYFGLEEKYNDLLSGTPQEILVPRDPYMIDELPTVPPGASLVTTIDREIQAMVERVLDHAVEKNGAESGTIIVSDPKTGEILAMATTPRLDPNKYWEYQKLFPNPTPFNRAVGQTYEPGSVFKVLTMAAGIDSGAVSPDTSFLDTGSIEVGGITIYNWDRGAWGPQNMTGCMQHSLNVCLAWVAVQMGPSTFYDYMKSFGIGHRTNVDLGGEVIWPLALPGDSNWFPVNLGTNSFGQGLAATPIQMVMAVSALANDGKMMSPHVLKAVIRDGKQVENPPSVAGTPISAESARKITEMLAVSLEEEASDALVEGYRVAGKTGTGEIPTEFGYTSGQTNASFVGWGPADDPRFLVYIWLEKPSSSIWGSIVAAPVFSEVVTNLVQLLNLPPDDVRHQLAGQ